jgi:hypothetical protein
MTTESPDGGRRRGAPTSGLNPGISAAGSAAKRTALDPSAGPAAIGGMLSLRNNALAPSQAASPLQARLTAAVTDITRLANAMEVLSIGLPEDAVVARHARST